MLFSSSQLLELFVVLCNVRSFFYAFSKVRSASAHAQSKSGPVRPDTLPARFSALFLAAQVIVCGLIPAIYIFAVVGAGFQQPPWMNAFTLPNVVSGVMLEGVWKNALRVLACVASISLNSISDNVFEHLSDQYHPIGRREKPRVVQTGPYAWVRHPLYSLAVLQTALWSPMFWSYVPLFTIFATAAVFAFKISIEEETIQRDDGIREEYRAYKRKVPARLVPYIW
jgi:protein-S-isoprenylcysteine O-methyltransferase Ste14